jgi:hypothetical protein
MMNSAPHGKRDPEFLSARSLGPRHRQRKPEGLELADISIMKRKNQMGNVRRLKSASNNDELVCYANHEDDKNFGGFQAHNLG